MGQRTAEKTDTVSRCVPRQDGEWMIVTRKGAAGSSPVEMAEGAHVVVANGIARRPA